MENTNMQINNTDDSVVDITVSASADNNMDQQNASTQEDSGASDELMESEDTFRMIALDGQYRVCRKCVVGTQAETISEVLDMDEEGEEIPFPTQSIENIERCIEWLVAYYNMPFNKLPKFARYLQESNQDVSNVRRTQTEFTKVLIVDEHDVPQYTSFLHPEFDDIISSNLETKTGSPYNADPQPFPCTHDTVLIKYNDKGEEIKPKPKLLPTPPSTGVSESKGEEEEVEPTEEEVVAHPYTDEDYVALMAQERDFNDPTTDAPASDPIWGLAQVLGRDLAVAEFFGMYSMTDLVSRRACELMDDRTPEVKLRLLKTHPTLREMHTMETIY